MQAMPHVQEAAAAIDDEQSLGWQLQQEGSSMVGKTIYRLWPDNLKWYLAEVTGFDEETGEFR